MTQRPRVVIIGAGFGGLYAARSLAGQPVDVLVIDRHNFHTFTPLLYQVATCGLDPSEIAYPIRNIFYDKPNLKFLMGEVTAIDYDTQHVQVKVNGNVREEPYNYLIVAAGSSTNYLGNDAIERNAFGLKDLRDAVNLRDHILTLFEHAAWAEDEDYRSALTTLVVVGGGPTGIETAGALRELYNFVLRKEYRQSHNLEAHVILIEALDEILPTFPDNLQQSAIEQLTSLGVEVILGNPVKDAGEGYIQLKDGRTIPTYTLVWAAGVKAAPMAEMLDVELARGGRVPVRQTLQTVERDHIYVVGDMAYLEDDSGQPYPQLIPVAKQQGIQAAQNILRRVRSEPEESFVYRDRGIMATIGRRRAVAYIYNRLPLTGYIAWIMWLALHLVWLLGVRNRLSVLVGWVWNYFTYDRSVRIILEPRRVPLQPQPEQQAIVEEQVVE